MGERRGHMGLFFKALVAFTFVVATSICVFSLAARGTGGGKGDLAIYIGSGDYGSFLTEPQRDELDVVMTAYQRGDFVDILVAAPSSLESTGHPPFAIAEYLNARGISEEHIKLDDEASSLIDLAAKTRDLLAFGGYQSPLVFSRKFDMPHTKLSMYQANLKNISFVPSASLEIMSLPQVAGKMMALAKTGLGLDKPAADYMRDLTKTARLEEDLVFKPLDLLSSNDVHIAWSRVSSTKN